MHVDIARRAAIRSRHSNRQLQEMAGTTVPPVTAWFAYIASCGFKVPDKKALASTVREGNRLGRELAIAVETAEGKLEYRLVAYDGRFHMRPPHDENEIKQIRLANVKKIYRRVKIKLKKKL